MVELICYICKLFLYIYIYIYFVFFFVYVTLLTGYYHINKERLQKKACESYHGLSEEEKTKSINI